MAGAHQNLNGSRNLTMPLQGWFAIHGLALATISLSALSKGFHYHVTQCYCSICCHHVSVHPSVCLSQVGSFTKTAKPRIMQIILYRCTIAQSYHFLTPEISMKSQWPHGVTLMQGQIEVGSSKSAIFDQYLIIFQKQRKMTT